MLATWVLVMSRASHEAWGMSTPTACLLFSQFVPATARLFVEFRRMRDSLPPAEARKFAALIKSIRGYFFLRGGLRYAHVHAPQMARLLKTFAELQSWFCITTALRLCDFVVYNLGA